MGSPLSKNSKARRRIEDPKSHAKPAADGGTTSNEFGVPYRDLEAKNDRLSFPLDKLHLSSISDQQLALLFSTAPKLHEYGGVNVVRLSKSLACKGGRGVFPSESQNMIFAAETLGLPVPRVHRTFTADVPGTEEGELIEAQFIVMDYIPGPTVKECWNSLKVDQRQLVAGQVASMIEKMQSTALKLPPGPVGWTGSQKFVGPWFTEDSAGPFASLQELEDWCNHKIDVGVQYEHLGQDAPRFKFRSLVLTHQDIAPQNLVLDAQGKVWMIDWAFAGIYPPGFEQAVLEVCSAWYREFAEMVLSKLSDRQEHITKQFANIGYGLSLAARI